MIERAQIIDGVINIPQSVIDYKAKKDQMVYLSDFMDKIPSNCLFLKGATGVGGTSLALQDDSNCIIAMPTRNTVQSKWAIRDENHNVVGYNTSLLCICGNMNDKVSDIREYINSRQTEEEPVKIVCTYDILGKVVDILTQDICISLENYRLYIDEYHDLLKIYNSKRKGNIKRLLECVSMFDDVTCITATPLPEKYIMHEFRDLSIIRVNYPQRPRIIDIVPTKQIEADTAKICLEHLKGLRLGNAYFFVNSVSFIAGVIKKLNIENVTENVRVICGDSDINKTKIKEASLKTKGYIGKNRKEIENVEEAYLKGLMNSDGTYGLEISSINSEPKKLNFITRTGFEGCDFFDPDAQQYIVSDNSRVHTMNDIATSYIQIMGRIRDAKSMNITHLFGGRSDKDTKVGFRYYNSDGKSQFEIDREERKLMKADAREKLIQMREIDPDLFDENNKLADIESKYYLTIDPKTNQLVYDEYLEWDDEINFDTIHGVYATTANFSAALMKNGLNVSVHKSYSVKDDEIVKLKKEKRIPFREVFETYVREMSGTLFKNEPSLKVSFLEQYDSLLYPAYHILGAERVRQLKYVKSAITREIKDRQMREADKKIYKYLNLQIGFTYTVSELEEKCKQVRCKLMLPDDIKITEYYETVSTTKRSGGKIMKARRIVKKLK